VAGLGCRLGRDDAIGLHLVESLGPGPWRVALWEDADSLTVAQALLEEGGPVVLVDCADMGRAPGEWCFFPASSVRLGVAASSVSTHGLGLAEALHLAQGLGRAAPAHVFGVQPYDLAPGLGLSGPMAARVPLLGQALRESVRSLGPGEPPA
jgi:hydrogenase maturation protease